MPASRIAWPAMRIMKVACWFLMKMSFRSRRVTPDSVAGDPKLMATLVRTGCAAVEASRPTRTAWGS